MEEKLFGFGVEGEKEGQRLDQFLAERLDKLSRMRIADLIAAGACKVNGEAARAGRRLSRGDKIEVALGEGVPSSMTPEPLLLEIVHEDEQLLVVVKPSGMLVHPTRGVKTGTLANALTYHLNRRRIEGDAFNQQPAARVSQLVRPGIVHRLDRDTSGLMVVAKTQRALSILTRHLHRRLFEKRYLALLEGRVVEDEMLIDAPIGRDAEAAPQWGVRAEGREARTRLRVLGRKERVTLVELEPVTGRTNQLRIHCAHVGHAVLGDVLYGRAAAVRLCLHASRLAFNHPAGGAWMEFTSALPAEVSAAWECEN